MNPAACNMLLACMQPSLVLCNQLTNAWSKTGAAGEIRAVMASMRLMGMRPDVYTWSSLVHAHAVARQTGRYTTAQCHASAGPAKESCSGTGSVVQMQDQSVKGRVPSLGFAGEGVLTRSTTADILIIVYTIQALM